MSGSRVSENAATPATGGRGSLRARLLISASVVLFVFILATGAALDSAFRESAYAAAEDRLKAAVYMMLGATEPRAGNTLALPQELPDPRLATPESGLYADVVDINGARIWRSRSAIGMQINYPPVEELGTVRFHTMPDGEGTGGGFLALSYAIAWEFPDGEIVQYAYRVAEDRAGFERQIAGYRRELWGWLAALAAGLLLVQAAVLRWGLAPLRRVADEIRAIESGERPALVGRYPAELQPLTTNLNRLIGSSQSHLQRHRNALADLAHSLKTPLAVLRGSLIPARDVGGEDATLVREQLDRMDMTINYQLQRAAASGRTALTAPVVLRSLVERLIATLGKVYQDKQVRFEVAVDPAHKLHCDEGDLIEILGNLLDNACKWCERQVTVRSFIASGDASKMLCLEIIDDGPGIPEAQKSRVMDRGVRADPDTEGQGIGLAVVSELVEQVYGGELALLDNTPRGTRVQVRIPRG